MSQHIISHHTISCHIRKTSAGTQLGLRWTCTRLLLDWYLTSTGLLLDLYGTSTGLLLDLYWTSAWPPLDFHCKYIISYPLIADHVILYLIILQNIVHIIAYHNVAYHILSCYYRSCHITAHHGISSHIIPYHIPYDVIYYHIIVYSIGFLKGPHLDLYWTSIGPLMDFYWSSTGPPLDIYLTFAWPLKPLLDFYWASTRLPLDFCWKPKAKWITNEKKSMPQGIASELQKKSRLPCSCPQGEGLKLATPSLPDGASNGRLAGISRRIISYHKGYHRTS